MMFMQQIVVYFSILAPAFSMTLSPTKSFTSVSGLPVSRYGLGGAARSTQPPSLPSIYYDKVNELEENVAPFFFYYNPNRYPGFMSGIKNICSTYQRRDIFVASGGTDRSPDGLNQRLRDCLKYCGGEYLDLFILEYIVPEELDNDDGEMKPGPEVAAALKHSLQWVEEGSVRYIGISTHSHMVGNVLSRSSEVDILMLRYGMSHKDAAESISLPAAMENGKSVIAFTTTRWNSLQKGIDDDNWEKGDAPSSADCLSFVFGKSPPVEAVLHSARDEDELFESMSGLRRLSDNEDSKWREYGGIFEVSNNDFFDEFPEERTFHHVTM